MTFSPAFPSSFWGGGLSTKLSTYPPLCTTYMEFQTTFRHFPSILLQKRLKINTSGQKNSAIPNSWYRTVCGFFIPLW
jgi:hypothetical protein